MDRVKYLFYFLVSTLFRSVKNMIETLLWRHVQHSSSNLLKSRVKYSLTRHIPEWKYIHIMVRLLNSFCYLSFSQRTNAAQYSLIKYPKLKLYNRLNHVSGAWLIVRPVGGREYCEYDVMSTKSQCLSSEVSSRAPWCSIPFKWCPVGLVDKPMINNH